MTLDPPLAHKHDHLYYPSLLPQCFEFNSGMMNVYTDDVKLTVVSMYGEDTQSPDEQDHAGLIEVQVFSNGEHHNRGYAKREKPMSQTFYMMLTIFSTVPITDCPHASQ